MNDTYGEIMEEWLITDVMIWVWAGVVFEVDQHQRHTVHVHTIPACMAQREANDRKRGKDPLSYEYLEVGLNVSRKVPFVF